MNNLQVVGTTSFSLENENLSLLTLNIDGEVYFASTMIATLFMYARPIKAVQDLVSEENKRSYIELENIFDNKNRTALPQGSSKFSEEFKLFAEHANINLKMNRQLMTTFITEEGFYELLMNSKMPIRNKLLRKVTHEILPAIRKYGVYTDRKLQQELAIATTIAPENQLSQEKENEIIKLTEKNDNLLLENSALKTDVIVLRKTLDDERRLKYISELNGFGDSFDINSPTARGRHRPVDIYKLFGFDSNRTLYPALRKYGFISSNNIYSESRRPTDLALELNLVKYKNNYSPPMFTDMGLAVMFVMFYNNGIINPYYIEIFKTIFKYNNFDIEAVKYNVRQLNKIKINSKFKL